MVKLNVVEVLVGRKLRMIMGFNLSQISRQAEISYFPLFPRMKFIYGFLGIFSGFMGITFGFSGVIVTHESSAIQVTTQTEKQEQPDWATPQWSVPLSPVVRAS